MNFNKFTIKSQEAVQNAQEIASSYSNQAIEPDQLLSSNETPFQERDRTKKALRVLGAFCG
jgi:ATP-dependent Clp protease ATP-binding subunit ClpB